jgi:hypothetical protein
MIKHKDKFEISHFGHSIENDREAYVDFPNFIFFEYFNTENFLRETFFEAES